ncbi:hypothetical protein BDV26DRAFT_204129 [Aspergillus bertholletiae]|uniref:Uncharacterized protein n=1 Tax=Aspergillus bertholletiae TaxID=1226010 RepID=A0A5N7B7Y6_9EURO|nr:hypothetical protein BDV26DRAFT_204129 [Aspergillus bertholletiae]
MSQDLRHQNRTAVVERNPLLKVGRAKLRTGNARPQDRLNTHQSGKQSAVESATQRKKKPGYRSCYFGSVLRIQSALPSLLFALLPKVFFKKIFFFYSIK